MFMFAVLVSVLLTEHNLMSTQVGPPAPWHIVLLVTESQLMRFHMPAAKEVAHHRVPASSTVHSAPAPLADERLWCQSWVRLLALHAAMTRETSALVSDPAFFYHSYISYIIRNIYVSKVINA